MKPRSFLGSLFLGVLPWLTLPVHSPAADVVVEWNAAMSDYMAALPPHEFFPPAEHRIYTMAHLAMREAVKRAGNTRGHPSVAAAQAAHDVLVHLLPHGAAEFDRLLARQLATVPDGPEKMLGLSVGAEAATRMLAARADDGFAQAEGSYTPGTKPGAYQAVAPFDKIAPPGHTPPYSHGPNLGGMKPFSVRSTDQFRAPAPYAVGDPEYRFDLDEVRVLGRATSTARTADETAIARFWYEHSGLGWNRLARLLAGQHPGTLAEHARFFATLNVAMTDTLLTGFESKYHYNFWRPVTALQATDPGWTPLLQTPPMPDYPSTHAGLGAAAAAVLIWHFKGDEHEFTLSSGMSREFPDLQPRSFKRISDAAFENAQSRMLVGIHFRRACLAGLEQGRQVGAWVVQQYAQDGGR